MILSNRSSTIISLLYCSSSDVYLIPTTCICTLTDASVNMHRYSRQMNLTLSKVEPSSLQFMLEDIMVRPPTINQGEKRQAFVTPKLNVMLDTLSPVVERHSDHVSGTTFVKGFDSLFMLFYQQGAPAAVATLHHRRNLIHHFYQLVDGHIAYNREVLSGKFCIHMRHVPTSGRDDTFAGDFQSKGKVSRHRHNRGTLALYIRPLVVSVDKNESAQCETAHTKLFLHRS